MCMGSMGMGLCMAAFGRRSSAIIVLHLVVQRVGNTINCINHCPVDMCWTVICLVDSTVRPGW